MIQIKASVLAILMALGAAEAQQVTLSPGSMFRDCADCPDMVVISSGVFTAILSERRDPNELLQSPMHLRSAVLRSPMISLLNL